MRFTVDRKFKKIPQYLTYKAVILTLVLFSSYSLVLITDSLIYKLFFFIIFVICLLHFAFNVLHEAHHGVATKSKTLNNFLMYGFDIFFGISSKLYRLKHNEHHTNTNVKTKDEDLESIGLLRLTAYQTHHFYHIFQPYYALLVYASLTITWPIYDVKRMIEGRVASRKIRFKFSDYVSVLLFKFIHYILFLYIPFVLYGKSTLLIFILIHLFLGVLVSLISLVAHIGIGCEAYEVSPSAKGWFESQLKSTANFKTNSWLLNLVLGGVNYHVVHHIYPGVPTIYYKEVNELLKNKASEYGLNINEFDSFRGAIMAHLKMLNKLSIPPHKINLRHKEKCIN